MMNASGVMHKLTTVDGSGRISLGRAKAGALYDAAFEPDGRVVLTPMVAIPARELWLHQNPAAMAMVDEGLAALAKGEKGVEIDLSQFPDDEEGDLHPRFEPATIDPDGRSFEMEEHSDPQGKAGRDPGQDLHQA
jgi:hypothetical protein